MKNMRLRKIEAMHAMFGKAAGICKDCKYFRGSIGGYKKCRIYGISASEATDWANKWPACGLKDSEYTGSSTVVEILKHAPKDKRPELQCEGQLEMEW